MPAELTHLYNRAQLAAMTGLLNRIAAELRQNTTEYKGTVSRSHRTESVQYSPTKP